MSANRYAMMAILAVVLTWHSGLVLGARHCYHCRGINCQRNSYAIVESCQRELDACVSVFEQGQVQAQGCLESMEEPLRQHCADEQQSNCHICIADKCNQLGASGTACVQCKESETAACRTAAESMTAELCPIARGATSYCYISSASGSLQRGCAVKLAEQLTCLDSADCQLCNPLDLGTRCNDQNMEAEVTTTTLQPTTGSDSDSSSTDSSSSSSSMVTTTSSTSISTSSSSDSTSTSSTTIAPTASTKPPGNSAAMWHVQQILLVLPFTALLMSFPQ